VWHLSSWFVGVVTSDEGEREKGARMGEGKCKGNEWRRMELQTNLESHRIFVIILKASKLIATMILKVKRTWAHNFMPSLRTIKRSMSRMLFQYTCDSPSSISSYILLKDAIYLIQPVLLILKHEYRNRFGTWLIDARLIFQLRVHMRGSSYCMNKTFVSSTCDHIIQTKHNLELDFFIL